MGEPGQSPTLHCAGGAGGGGGELPGCQHYIVVVTSIWGTCGCQSGANSCAVHNRLWGAMPSVTHFVGS